MAQQFLSRHFLGEQASCISLVPFAAPGAPDQNGVSTAHNLLAMGTWSEEAQEHHLTICDLVVGHSGDQVASQPTLVRLAAFQHSGRVTAVQAASLGGGNVLLAAASADGGVSRLRMQVPLAPGSQPDSIQLQGEDIDGAMLQPWLDLHPAPTTSLDINADSREVVSTSGRGTIAVSSVSDDGSEGGSSFYECGGALTFSCSRWTTPNTFVTGCMQGVLHVWDRRQPGQPQQQGAAGGGQPISCLAVHPAQPHVCASGSSDGSLLIWDLRQGSKPAFSISAGQGSVRDLHFNAAGDAPQLVFSTASGFVGTARESGRVRCIYREPSAAVEGLCLGAAGATQQLMCVSDQEALIFMAGVL